MNLDAHLPVLQVLAPMLAAPLVALFQHRGLSWFVAVLASALCLANALALLVQVDEFTTLRYALGGWPAPYGIELVVGKLEVLLLLLISGSSLAALLAGVSSLDLDLAGDRSPMFYSAWLMVLAGLSGIVVSGDAFNVFVFMEISSLAGYVLIAAGTDRRALSAVFKYLITGTVGATFYLIGIGLLYMMTGTLNFADLTERVSQVESQRPVIMAAGFITVGLALKAAIFPLHVWLPGAYTHAPNAVTAFFAVCSTKVAVYVLFVFEFTVFRPNLDTHALHYAVLLVPLVMLGTLLCSATACLELNIKRLLAFSSLAQIGYIVLGSTLDNLAGLTAAGLHMFNHGLAKGGLFLGLCVLGLRASRLELTQIAGLGRAMPWTAAAISIAGLSLIGVPGTAGFISKWYLLEALLRAGNWGYAAAAVVVVTSLMAVVYIGRILESLWMGQATGQGHIRQEAPPVALFVLWLVAIANIYYGLYPDLPLDLAQQGAASLIGQAE